MIIVNVITVLLWQLCVLHNASYNTIMLIVVVLVTSGIPGNSGMKKSGNPGKWESGNEFPTSDRIHAIRGKFSDW